MTTNYAIWWFLRPSHLLIFLLLVGLGLRLKGRVRSGRVALFTGGIGLLVAGILPVGSCLMAPLENRFPVPSLPADVTGIIVLAGSEQPAATARRGSLHFNDHSERLLVALTLAHRYPRALLVHSGRTPLYEDAAGTSTTASDVAHELFRSAGIDEGRLLLEDRSTNTCESQAYLLELIEPQQDDVWLLVTSAFHMPRSVACFRAASFEVVPYPVDYQAGGSWLPLDTSIAANLERLDLAAHEWLGLIYYRVRGRTEVLFPAP